MRTSPSIFSLQGRRARLSFFLWHLSTTIIFVVGCFISFGLVATSELEERSFGGLALLLLLGMVIFWIQTCLSVQRFHDCGRTGWWVLVYSIPALHIFVWLYQIFCPGTYGPNRYGPDPFRPELGSVPPCAYPHFQQQPPNGSTFTDKPAP